MHLLVHRASTSAFFAISHPKNLFQLGVPTRPQLLPSTLGTAVFAGSNSAPRSTSAPPSPWRDSEALSPPAFSPIYSAWAGSRPGTPFSVGSSSWDAGEDPGRIWALPPPPHRPSLPQNRTLHGAGRAASEAKGREATSVDTCGRRGGGGGVLYLLEAGVKGGVAGARLTLAKHSRHPLPYKRHWGWRGRESWERMETWLFRSPKSPSLRFPHPHPKLSLLGMGRGGRAEADDVERSLEGGVRKNNSHLPPPLERCFPPTHHPGLLGKGPA